MSLQLVTAPTDYPVTLAEAKAQCRVDNDAEDAALQTYIAAATSHVESYTGRAIMPQTWELVLDDFSDAIMFPKGPVTAVSSVKYIDTAAIEQTVTDTNYSLDSASDPQWLVKADDYTWPEVSDGVNNVTIRFVAGYSTVPPEIKLAILLLIGLWYDNRAAASDRAMMALPHAVDALLCNHRQFA
jgi:uncharacterized phiE125 gp8 family phage protein